ncbi:MAG: hypothetical protein K0R25_38 [Rickettsiaceae bacterium]|jgi:hypothetical protein|nr:hypothetical protein [Rickettsiaceae bacterium]
MPNKSGNNKELELFDGVLKVGSVKGSGYSIDLAKILHKFINQFKNNH